MKPENLCLYCMNQGVAAGGTCKYCGTSGKDDPGRSPAVLPLGYFLHNRYYIGRVLGQGGFGITYAAWDSVQNCRVAIKELFPCKDVQRRSDRTWITVIRGQETYFSHVKKRFLDEARNIAAMSQYPDMLKVYHLFPDNGTAYYAMEFIDGMDLKEYTYKNGTLPWEKLSTIIESVINQLKVLHSNNFIHRDISPDNIFICKNGKAKLIDFGSVRTYNNNDPKTTFLKHNFAPPEQYRENGEQGPWTDIYALSATMYYVLSGVLPTKAPDRAMGTILPKINGLVPGMPKNVAEAVMRGLELPTEKRIRDMNAFSAMLFGSQSHANPTRGREISVTEGTLKGRRITLKPDMQLTVGRSPSKALAYPLDTPGVSRAQCTLITDRGFNIFVRDDGSSYGTLQNGRKLTAGTWNKVNIGDIIAFGNEKLTVI